jgi:hypothetical protein
MESKPLIPGSSSKINRFDKGWVGFSGGFILPVVALMIYYYKNFSFLTIDSFLFFTFFRKIFPPLFSLCVAVNLGLFFLFYWRNYNYAARGVIAVTLFYTIIVFILKFYLGE